MHFFKLAVKGQSKGCDTFQFVTKTLNPLASYLDPLWNKYHIEVYYFNWNPPSRSGWRLSAA